MMDQIIQLISNVGFPIAMCVMLFWYINHTMKDIKVAIENNTKVVELLNDRINKLEDK